MQPTEEFAAVSEDFPDDDADFFEDFPATDSESVEKPKKQHRYPLWKRILLVLIILAELFLIISIYLNSKLDLINHVANVDIIYDADRDVMSDSDVKNILLIGEDHRKWESAKDGHSDTMIICSINKKTDTITLCSLMRDMYVPIPGNGSNRINAAYTFGGISLLDQTIEENFGVDIDANVVVDFDGFLSALEVIGNLDIDLTQAEASFLNETKSRDLLDDADQVWNLKEGTNSMTPEQALAYARDRYTGNADWARTERQRKVIFAAYDKLKGSSLGKVMKVANKVFPYITTDLSNSQLLGYIYTVASGGMELRTDFHLPVDGTFSGQMINGMDVLVPDCSVNAKYLQQYLYGETISGETMSTEASTRTDSGNSGTPNTPSTNGKTTSHVYSGGAYSGGTTAVNDYHYQYVATSSLTGSDAGSGSGNETPAAPDTPTEPPTQAPTQAPTQPPAQGGGEPVVIVDGGGDAPTG